MPAEEKSSLLIAEDDANIRYLLEMAALRTGVFQTLAAVGDGREALDWLQEREPEGWPDFILTDLSMPRMTGLDLLRALKADARLRAIPVAVITSSNVPNDRSDALAAGACAFLEKPHGLEALTQALLSLPRGSGERQAKRHHAA